MPQRKFVFDTTLQRLFRQLHNVLKWKESEEVYSDYWDDSIIRTIQDIMFELTEDQEHPFIKLALHQGTRSKIVLRQSNLDAMKMWIEIKGLDN